MYKILIIEDEEPLRKILSERFTQAGFKVETAKDGKDGVNAAQNFLPEFILLDMIMPEMDGVTALRHLKQLPITQNIPVAVLSALTETVPESLHPEVSLDKNVVAYFRKDTEQLTDIIAKVKQYLDTTPSVAVS